MASITVLIVDDHHACAQALGLALFDLGYRTVTAFCAREAIEAVRREPVDVLIVDYDMPDVRGDDLARQLVAIRSIRRKILVSARDLSETGLINSFDLILGKPFELEHLENFLRNERIDTLNSKSTLKTDN